jgi:hypothetical protein
VVPPAEPAPTAPAPCRPKNYLPGWPFLLYLMAWAGLAAATVVLLAGPGSASTPVDDPFYPTLLLAGLTLAVCGPVLSLVVWIVARTQGDAGMPRRPADDRAGARRLGDVVRSRRMVGGAASG